MAGRKIDVLTDRDQARQKLDIFAGMDIPSTVVRKELLDNEIDVLNESGQRADECTVFIGPNRIKLMDNGSGISTSTKRGSEYTHLWLACAKMFSSSNYGGVQDTVGTHGVGLTIANYTSKRFNIMMFNAKNVEGYGFIDGFLCGTEECIKNVMENPEDHSFTDKDREFCVKTGDWVKNPLTREEGVEMFHPFYQIGFMVDVEFHHSPNLLFPDEADISWLVEYVKKRMGENKSGTMHLYRFTDDSFTRASEHSSYHWTTDPQKDGKMAVYENTGLTKTGAFCEEYSYEYVRSWKEQVDDAGAITIRDGEWTFAFGMDTERFHVDSIVQGAPINSRYTIGQKIEIQDYVVSVQVPFSMKYLGKEQPKYTDQTKINVRFPYYQVEKAFERSGNVYQHFYREAEKRFMAQAIKDSESSMFWPLTGDPSEGELIIAEGYSAISGLRTMRNPVFQACIALRGKILNCWNLDMQKAMRSDVVKQILNAVIYTPYKRIVIAVDADPDGIGHICPLLVAMLARFTNLIQEGKVYFVHTPHYLFKKRGKETLSSDDANDCPEGYHVTTLKGLGGMDSKEVEKYVMNPDTRDLVQIVWDDKAEDNLDMAFSRGAEDWILTV